MATPSPAVRIMSLPEHRLSAVGEARSDDPLWAEAQALVDKWTVAYRRHPRARRLRPIQAAVLELASIQAAKAWPAGLLGQVGVGKGKTLAFMLLARVFGIDNPLLLLPPDMLDETREARWEWSKEYDFPDMRLLSYSKLSHHKSTAMLREIAPGIIFADECQALKNDQAARTMRFLRYMRANQGTRFVGLTGTLSQASVEEYATLSYLSLRQESPLPIPGQEDSALEAWASVLDAGTCPDQSDYLMVSPLAGGKAYSSKAPYRKAFNKRLGSAPGFILTRSSACQARLEVHAEHPPLSQEVIDHLERLSNDYVLPDGTEIVEAIEHARAAKQLSLGFYYRWVWPNGEPDEDWLGARSAWAAAVREYLKHHAREGLDSPFLVQEAVRHGRIKSHEMRSLLSAWLEQSKKPKPPTEAVWLDYGPLVHAIAWAEKKDMAFLWFQSRAVGKMLQAFGVPSFWEGLPDPRKHKVAALSIEVYHKGKNFQPWSDQLILEPPPNAAKWEQLLGRTHRPGQRSAVVRAHLYQHSDVLVESFQRARAKARYIEDTTGQEQKLLMAHYYGLPG
jgi:hypothetical protein